MRVVSVALPREFGRKPHWNLLHEAVSQSKRLLGGSMSSRPSIPTNVKRDVLHESRHRCAVCGHALSLEMAHVIPWRKTKDHSLENLIALCPNCHSQADSEDWGADYLRRYKNAPFALEGRQAKRTTASQQAAIDLIMGADPDDLPLSERFKILKQVAVFLEIPLQEVDLLGVKRTNSSRVTLGLPKKSAYALYEAFSFGDNRLFYLFRDLDLLRIELPRVNESWPIAATPALYPIPLQPIGFGTSLGKLLPVLGQSLYHSSARDWIPIAGPRTGALVGEAELFLSGEPGRLRGVLHWRTIDRVSDPRAYLRFQISVLGENGRVIHQSRVMRIDAAVPAGEHEFSMDVPRYVAQRAVALRPYISLVSRED